MMNESRDELMSHGGQREVTETSPLISSSTDFGAIQTEQNTEDGEEKEEEFKLSRLKRRSKYTLLILALANLFASCGFSLLAPFFPQEAEKKGVSNTVTGLIFSVFEFVIFASSPIFGNYISHIGPKFMYVSGIIVGGCCCILFGLLDKSPNGTPFIVICFACRTVEALGLSAFITSSFAIISNEFPKNVATVFGILETASGIGMMVGPGLGGALYEAGGFGLPFFVLGGAIICNGLMILNCLPAIKPVEKKPSFSMLRLLRSPIVVLTLANICMAAIAIGFIDPTLAKHIDSFGLSVSVIGLIFVIAPGLYGFTAPLWGYISDTKDIQAPLIIVGNLGGCIGFLLIGPTPLFSFLPFKLWLVIIALVLFGLTIGCSFVPAVKLLVVGAKELGFEDNIDTYGIVSGLFNSVFCLGGFVGPMLGGVLIQEVGFDYGATVISGMFALDFLVCLTFFVYRRANKRPEVEIPDEEKPQAVTADRRRSSLLLQRSLSGTSPAKA